MTEQLGTAFRVLSSAEFVSFFRFSFASARVRYWNQQGWTTRRPRRVRGLKLLTMMDASPSRRRVTGESSPNPMTCGAAACHMTTMLGRERERRIGSRCCQLASRLLAPSAKQNQAKDPSDGWAGDRTPGNTIGQGCCRGPRPGSFGSAQPPISDLSPPFTGSVGECVERVCECVSV